MMLYRPDIIDSDDYNLIYSLIAGHSSGTVAALVATALTQYPVRLPKSLSEHGHFFDGTNLLQNDWPPA